MKAYQETLEKEWQESEGDDKERVKLALLGAYAMIAFAGSFRGHEVFLVDTYGLLKYISQDRFERGDKFVVIPLLGKYKTENVEGYHLTPLIAGTSSGLQIEIWVKRLAWAKGIQGICQGPAFSTEPGLVLNVRWLELEILERFVSIQQANSDLIPQEVNVYEDYGISRSFRRGSTTEARNKRVNEEDIDLMNRWRSFESAKGRRPRMRMQDHYSDIAQMVPSLLRYSKAL